MNKSLDGFSPDLSNKIMNSAQVYGVCEYCVLLAAAS